MTKSFNGHVFTASGINGLLNKGEIKDLLNSASDVDTRSDFPFYSHHFFQWRNLIRLLSSLTVLTAFLSNYFLLCCIMIMYVHVSKGLHDRVCSQSLSQGKIPHFLTIALTPTLSKYFNCAS